MGHKGPVKVRPRCIGVEKALNPISVYLSIYLMEPGIGNSKNFKGNKDYSCWDLMMCVIS
jgi:hypothetical protein